METIFVNGRALMDSVTDEQFKRVRAGEVVELLPAPGPNKRYQVMDWPPDTRLPLAGDLGLVKPESGVKIGRP